VTALVIEGESCPLAMVSCDIAYVPNTMAEKVRKKLSGLKGFNPENTMLSATHTHTAPYNESSGPSDLWGDYFDFTDEFVGDIMQPSEFYSSIVENIVEAITEAWELRSTGGIAFELAYPGVGFSRRTTYKDGSTVMYGVTNQEDFNGFEEAFDPGMELMFTFDDKENITGVVANIACPSQAIELSRAISADYMGEARRLLKEKHDIYLLGQIAPAGCQAPRDMLRQRYKKSANYFSRDHHDDAHMVEMGRRMAESIGLRMDGASKNIEWDLAISASYNKVNLPLFEVTPEEYKESKVVYEAFDLIRRETNDDLSREQKDVYKKHAGIYNRYQLQNKSNVIESEVIAFKLGDAAFISDQFELYTIYGMQIKGRSPANQTFCVQLTNGKWGYLPSQRAVDGGNYGAQAYSCYIGPKGGDELVEKSLEIINKLFEK
jgi:hypothetical protein